jgi:drug/metabolite transporter (DMT)-like permease
MLFLTTGVAALIWSIIGIIRKKYFNQYDIHEDLMVVAMAWGTGLSALIFGVLILGLPEIKPDYWYAFIVSVGLNFFIQYLGTKALKLEDISIVSPLSTTTPIFLILTSAIILGEYPTFWGKLGIFLSGVGAYIIYLRGPNVEYPAWIPGKISFYLGPWLRLYNSKGARLALISAYFASMSIPFDKVAVINSNPAISQGFAYLTIGTGLYFWSKLNNRWNNLNKIHFKKIFLLGCIGGFASILNASAFYYGIAPYVGALKRVQVIWTVALAIIFLKEKHGSLKIIGSIILILGAILMAF